MVRLRRFWARRLSIPFCGDGTAALSCLGGRKGLVAPHVVGGGDEDEEGALAVDIYHSTFVFLVVDHPAAED